MKYYFGILTGRDRTIRTRQTVLHGSVRPSNWTKGRIDFFDSINIRGYIWNITKQRWDSDDDMWTGDSKHDDYISDKMTNVPKSAKAFNRYIQKLVKEQTFPKGTVIQLGGRFNGIGIFCIL